MMRACHPIMQVSEVCMEEVWHARHDIVARGARGRVRIDTDSSSVYNDGRGIAALSKQV